MSFINNIIKPAAINFVSGSIGYGAASLGKARTVAEDTAVSFVVKGYVGVILARATVETVASYVFGSRVQALRSQISSTKEDAITNIGEALVTSAVVGSAVVVAGYGLAAGVCSYIDDRSSR
ncbi:MAG: hypothetical protein IPJ69_09475 [Deltaproteobacteria bacterium]|nr:MAG: hypothetical protein IPJ69_09475 [Deltaproteobacteria bacterium]